MEYTDARFKFVRDYRAVISKSLCGIRHWQDPNYRIKVLRAIGMCELILNLGVPVLQSFALAVIRNAGKTADIRLASDGLRGRVNRELRSLGTTVEEVKPRRIEECARQSFAIAFGCEPQEQEYLERFFDNWVFDISTSYYHGAEWLVEKWEHALPCTSEVYPPWQNAKDQI